MTNPADLRPARSGVVELEVRRIQVPCPELNRFFYTAVGGDWCWIDRLKWTYDQWLRYLSRPELETWMAFAGGNPAGYFELEVQPEANVEIAYIGLLPQFTGQGLGGRLVTLAAQHAWQKGAKRVWLHTCSMDHPRALANYLARGFHLFKKEEAEEDLPDQTPGPWPGSGPRTHRSEV
jgi:ribosomal protein S18 acetylase RimI-like enzyme